MNQATTSVKVLLRRVKDGEEVFTPENETLEALEDFQFLVKNLKMAFSQQLIGSMSVQPQNEVRGTDGMISTATVSGGLTVKGEEYLSTKHASRFSSWLTTQVIVAIAGVIVTVICFVIIDLIGI